MNDRLGYLGSGGSLDCENIKEVFLVGLGCDGVGDQNWWSEEWRPLKGGLNVFSA